MKMYMMVCMVSALVAGVDGMRDGCDPPHDPEPDAACKYSHCKPDSALCCNPGDCINSCTGSCEACPKLP